jgi:hypothetical protein
MRCGDARGAWQITSHSMHREADCQANRWQLGARDASAMSALHAERQA